MTSQTKVLKEITMINLLLYHCFFPLSYSLTVSIVKHQSATMYNPCPCLLASTLSPKKKLWESPCPVSQFKNSKPTSLCLQSYQNNSPFTLFPPLNNPRSRSIMTSLYHPTTIKEASMTSSCPRWSFRKLRKAGVAAPMTFCAGLKKTNRLDSWIEQGCWKHVCVSAFWGGINTLVFSHMFLSLSFPLLTRKTYLYFPNR